MVNNVVYSEKALKAAIRGEYDQLDLKIEHGSRFTLLPRQETWRITRLASRIFSRATTWGSPEQVRTTCKKIIQNRLKGSKTQKIFHKFLNLVRNGCVLDRRYEMEIPYLHPDKQGLSFYHKELAEIYHRECKDKTLDMISWYQTEEGQTVLEQRTGVRDIHAFTIHYFSKEEKENLVVEYKKIDGNLRLFVQGKPLSTLSEEEKTIENSLSMFVMGHDGSLYVTQHAPGTIQHSSFFMGLPVISAGEIITNATGEILYLSNRSGHYKPSEQSTLHMLRQLRAQGVDLSKVTLLMHSTLQNPLKRGRFNALQFLESQGNCPRLSNGITLPSGEMDLLMLAP